MAVADPDFCKRGANRTKIMSVVTKLCIGTLYCDKHIHVNVRSYRSVILMGPKRCGSLFKKKPLIVGGRLKEFLPTL